MSLYAFAKPDQFNIEGQKEHTHPLPTGYIYCPGCAKACKLRGIDNRNKVWFGTCQFCKYRMVFRPSDKAFAYVDNSGILHSLGFESRNFTVYVGDKVLYPYTHLKGEK